MSLFGKAGSGRVALASLGLMLMVLWSGNLPAQEESTPKVELFTGYQWLNPGGDVPAPGFNPNRPLARKLPSIPQGIGASLTYNFDKHWGLEGDYGGNWNKFANESTGTIGPRFTWRTEGMNLFVHTLVGMNRLTVKGLAPSTGVGAVLGGGIDLKIWRPLSFRLFEADYVLGREHFGDNASQAFGNLRRPTLNGARLRTGLVWNFGGAPELPPGASCSVQPSEVMVGEPVTATATGSNFNPKHTLTYSWNSTGGKATSKDNTATIDTNGVAGGSYTVTAHITDPKKKGGEASCSASFTVKEPPKNPPSISCSANPTNVQIGTSSSITCTCTSPDNVPVTVSGWTASGGSLSGSDNSATLSTAGASAGSVTVSATCTDSRGLTASASTRVTVENPPPPPQANPLETRLALHSIYFVTAQPTIQNPKGGLLASQQQTLRALASDFVKYIESKPDAHLILVGHADRRGTAAYNQKLSERRVERTKGFLVEHGVPAENIETKALGAQDNLTDDQVREMVGQNPELSEEERARIIRNVTTIRLASNRRVDITLSTTGQTSVRQYPFNAADSLSLIGGREAAAPKKAAPTAKKKATKKKP